MNVKAFEIRDKGTFIPALAVLMVPSLAIGTGEQVQDGRERYLLRRAGFGFDHPSVILCRMEASGTSNNATYDAFAWGTNGTRTMTVAHQYIEEHWDELQSGAVICVEHILGERATPKESEAVE